MNKGFYAQLRAFSNAKFWRDLHIDFFLVVSLALVAGGGLIILYSASGQDVAMVERQFVRLSIGFAACLFLAQVPPKFLRRLSPLLYLGVFSLLVMVLFFGVGAKGAQRWLEIPGIGRFQPSELMKVVMPMAVAWYFSNRHLPPKFKHISIVLIMVAVPVFVIARQPDLGTSLLVGVSGIFALFLAGLGWRYILGAALSAPIAGFFLWQVMHAYQKQRVLTFLNPESDPLGSGWNIIQSKTAIGSGGLEGKGFLSGTQAQLEFLPESHTDFIIAVLAEEFGMFGCLILLTGYLLIIARGLYIAAFAEDNYARLLAGSLTLTFFVYIFVNIGMVSGILPVVGVPLPLVSYGGTSIITIMSTFGILMSIHTHKRARK
ncbi:MAG: rod shape-determining protein RodA [Marinomonas sp.]|jgi:rod shape determining protein RodA|uniref:rod shape-determining protein RodA n=1 Tax=unclassified Marinomonas TaxID=196814 RepID=UPI0005FA18FC|nr:MULTISPECIES: rod shape-determining protein RodA [unclassified Marinomonas]KJZ14991.1 rod shape-determining protein RodA [Marinomonas sp. S3726]KZM41609.1 rod shape-determining protein RodA [Marinomonas sp. SBI22]KZM43445.1 rod shape-determining protein RodA [Marinomonas sp. SBI8L]